MSNVNLYGPGSNLSKLKELKPLLAKRLTEPAPLHVDADFDSYGLTTCPNEIFCNEQLMRELKTVILSNNKIKKLPKTLVDCEAITELNLSHNEFETWPLQLEDLTTLEELHFDNNYMNTITEQLGELTNLTRLELKNNNFRTNW